MAVRWNREAFTPENVERLLECSEGVRRWIENLVDLNYDSLWRVVPKHVEYAAEDFSKTLFDALRPFRERSKTMDGPQEYENELEAATQEIKRLKEDLDNEHKIGCDLNSLNADAEAEIERLKVKNDALQYEKRDLQQENRRLHRIITDHEAWTAKRDERIKELEDLYSRIREWTSTHGKSLCPGLRPDTFGEGTREAKAQVARLLSKVPK